MYNQLHLNEGVDLGNNRGRLALGMHMPIAACPPNVSKETKSTAHKDIYHRGHRIIHVSLLVRHRYCSPNSAGSLSASLSPWRSTSLRLQSDISCHGSTPSCVRQSRDPPTGRIVYHVYVGGWHLREPCQRRCKVCCLSATLASVS
jgi:hypothetical protein